MSEFHDPFDCPDETGDHCEDARRRILFREGLRIPGLTPKREDAVARGDELHQLPRPLEPLPFGVEAGVPIPLVEEPYDVENEEP